MNSMIRVHHLEEPHRQDLIATMSRELASRLDVSLAWVFGSFLEPGGFRDIDVAIWVDATADPRADLDLAVRLSRAAGFPVDVRVANQAPLRVLFHMLRGRLLLVRDDRLLADLIEGTARRYHDQAPLVRQATRDAFAA
jgi:predicted nucleotidyltransferase